MLPLIFSYLLKLAIQCYAKINMVSEIYLSESSVCGYNKIAKTRVVDLVRRCAVGSLLEAPLLLSNRTTRNCIENLDFFKLSDLVIVHTHFSQEHGK